MTFAVLVLLYLAGGALFARPLGRYYFRSHRSVAMLLVLWLPCLLIAAIICLYRRMR